MFEVPLDTVVRWLLYSCLGFGIIFAIAKLLQWSKAAFFAFSAILVAILILCLTFSTRIIHTVCMRQENSIVTCEKTQFFLFGLFQEAQIISPVTGVETRKVRWGENNEYVRTEIYLRSQDETYLLSAGHFYFPFRLLPWQDITHEIEDLIVGKGEPVRRYYDFGGLYTLAAWLVLVFLWSKGNVIFKNWIRPTLRNRR